MAERVVVWRSLGLCCPRTPGASVWPCFESGCADVFVASLVACGYDIAFERFGSNGVLWCLLLCANLSDAGIEERRE